MACLATSFGATPLVSALRTILSCFLLMRLSFAVFVICGRAAAGCEQAAAGCEAAAGAQAAAAGAQAAAAGTTSRPREARAAHHLEAGALRAVLLLPSLLLLAALADLALLLPDLLVDLALRRLHGGARARSFIRWSHDGFSPLPHFDTLIVEDAAPVFAVFHGRVLPIAACAWLRRRF